MEINLQEFYTSLVDSSNDAIVGKDLKGNIISWNHGAELLYGYKASEIIGMSLEEIFSQEEKHKVLALLKKIKAGESIQHFETIRNKRDGTLVKVSMSFSPVRDQKGKIIGAASISRPVPFVNPEQRRFELAAESAPYGLLMVNEKGKIKYVNRQLEKMFGYFKADLIDQPVEVLIPTRFRKKHVNYRNQFINDPEARPMGVGRELFGLRRDGSEFPVEIGLNPLITAEETTILALVIDITERRRLAKRFEMAVEASPTGMLMISRTGEIELMNSQIVKMFGYEKKELIKQNIEMLIPERKRAKHQQLWFKYFEKPQPCFLGADRKLCGLRKNGTEFQLEVGINPLVTDEGSFILVSVVDITDRLREQERFRLAIEATPSGILMINKLGEIELANAQVLKMFKYKKEDLIGRKVEVLVPERFRAVHPQYRASYFIKPTTRPMGSGRDLFGLRSDGSEFPVEIGLNPLVANNDTYVLASVIDITERKQVENLIRKSNTDLERFAYVVSHDLKAPLRGIATVAEWIKEGYGEKLDDEGKNYLYLLDTRVKRLQGLIDGILEYSRIGRTKETIEKINIYKLLIEIIEVLMPPEHIEFKLQDHLPTVYASRTHIYQIFQNLISNAIKYNDKSQGLIEIGGVESTFEWKFFVKDNGIGIDKRYQDKVFELFQTLDTKEKKPESTGIGLTLSKKLVELYNGRIWFESTLGEGTTFYFTISKEQSRRMNLVFNKTHPAH